MFRLYEPQPEVQPGRSLAGCLVATLLMIAVMVILLLLGRMQFLPGS